jgi:hypothetical protein
LFACGPIKVTKDGQVLVYVSIMPQVFRS